ncbi:hypothetical protein NGM10_00715 [Halorussus salilacus]|uniref:DUF7504 family protein n=1 Tax=Halorussus salilacus TaxID=2953750 RepID=UPI0020A0A2B2|nr:hypothetical protein [Halorussus salilacus]USZ68279.1 hypothetical protein NGM10_00715 [Halorussus salilacus]
MLTRLKQDGCNLLVTGAVSEDVTEQATRTLLGAPDEDRKRIVALADSGGRAVDERLPAGVDATGSDVWVVDQRAHRRSVPRAAESGEVDLPTPGDDDGLAQLREELVIAIDYFDGATDDLGPSELRLSVSSLGWLAHEHGPDAVTRFVRSVSAMVRGVRGMAHYHLPRPDDDDLVDRLSPLFDARIELRKRDGLPTEQRWHVPRHDQTTDWVRL